MDFEFIETLLELPEFRVIGQVINPHELHLQIERRESYLVCPRCHGGCLRIKEGRDRGIRESAYFRSPSHLVVAQPTF